jgi:pyruvate kinase
LVDIALTENPNMKQQRPDPVLERVRNVRGTAAIIASACGVVREAVWRWQHVPARHVLTVEQLLDIPRHRIRPDLYPPPSHASTKRWLTNNGRRIHARP